MDKVLEKAVVFLLQYVRNHGELQSNQIEARSLLGELADRRGGEEKGLVPDASHAEIAPSVQQSGSKPTVSDRAPNGARREVYNAYQRQYMRAYRERKR